MSSNILKEAHFVGLLLKAEKHQRAALLNTMSNDQMRALVEIIYNVLHGYGHITDHDKRYLKYHKNIIRQLVVKALAAKRRKKLLRRYYSVVSRLLKVIHNNITVQWRVN